MTGIAVVASAHDAKFAEEVRAGLQAAGRDASVSQSLPKAAGPHVFLIWSAALGAGHAIDAQALIGLWSEDRLLVVRRDATLLPLGLRDLPSLPPGTTVAEICAALPSGRQATSDIAGHRDSQVVLGSMVELDDVPKALVVAGAGSTGTQDAGLAKPPGTAPDDAQPPKSKSRVGLILAAILAVAFAGGGIWYFFNQANFEKQAALTAALETATKASQELQQAQAKQQESLKALEEARAKEIAALKSGDAAQIKEAQEAAKRAEAEAAKQADAVKQREAAAADARKKAQGAAEGAKISKAAEPIKAESVAVAPAPVAKAPEPVAKASEPAAKAPEPLAKSAEPPRAKSRSEREREEEDRLARVSASKKSVAVASAPSASVEPAPAASAPPQQTAELLQQAEAMEASDPRGAVKIYRSLARNGNGKAAKRLGEIYDKGIPGIARDYAESLQWYETARKLGETIESSSTRAEATPAARPAEPEASAAVQPAPSPAPPVVAAIPGVAKPEPKSVAAKSAPLVREPARPAPAARPAPPPEPVKKAEPAPAPATVPEPPKVAAAAPGPAPAPPVEDLFQQAQGMEAVDPLGAVRIYRSLARNGNGKAAKRLGEIYDRGLAGIPRDYAESLQWYETARKLGETVETASRRDSDWIPARGLLIALFVLALIAWRRSRRREKAAAKQARRESTGGVNESAEVVFEKVAARRDFKARKDANPAAPGDSMLFVSYSHKDRPRVEPVVSVIEEMGRRVWMDRSDITGQTGWAGQIVRAIRECRAVVLMASPNSYSSDQVVRELYLAMNHKKTIVPIEIEPAEMPDELQYILAPFQHHRLSGRETREVIGRALAAV